ncbi:hypothetical protein BDQ12DRAFT_695917 [Crucibulum laeve]|uniref:Uncharacterized protein n=1 Tax=Crucibulum laeve TaxID=68775 RepID=A0A5C3MHQ6_9AGAR|nr:hypothetical protein BDQ12DRAFT_695917 [Crucibulum laeve]
MYSPQSSAGYPRRHRKRISALKLSSDTTSTLPEYISAAPGWQFTGSRRQEPEENIPSDRPPDYPDSAEEADKDTDSDSSQTLYVPQQHFSASTSALTSPRSLASPRSSRGKRPPPTHKRRHSVQPTANSTDLYLDSLLERSVHALEMSNTLLQSSISTQTSLSAILASDSPADHTLEARAQVLSSRIRGNWDGRDTWAEDLEEIGRRVEGLFGEDLEARSRKISNESISCSLPASTSPLQQRGNRRRPSLDLRQARASESVMPRLHLSTQERAHLISPPPRALTQYVESTQDPESIFLPSTIGLRAPSSIHPSSSSIISSTNPTTTSSNSDWRPLSDFASSSTTSLHAQLSLPSITDKPLEPSTPAYNMLSSFVRRGSTSTGGSVERASPSRGGPRKSPERNRSESGSTSTSRSSRSQTPKQTVSPRVQLRPMTPPAEESSSSSDGCVAKRTVVSLRKILDDQPTLKRGHEATSPSPSTKRLRAPNFLPRTPPPAAEAGTSTATASISRLLTKGTHSSSTRPPSPPRQSAMKRPSPAGTAPSTPLTPLSPSHSQSSSLSIPDLFSAGMARALGSNTPSSGRSTPKRISFAQLPESYASSRPEGSSAKFRERKEKKSKGKGKGKGRTGGSGKEKQESGGWFSGWLGPGPSGLNVSLAKHEERMEDRMSRSWGGRMGSGLDEWAV